MTAPFIVPPPPARVDVIGLVAANITPVAGILFLDWSALNLVAIYAVDMTLTLIALSWLVMMHVTEVNDPERSIKRSVKIGVSALLAGLILAGILVAPMLLFFADTGWWSQQSYLDPGFRGALAVQVVGSLIGCVRTHRMLDERTDDENYLKAQLKFAVARWIIVLGVTFFGAGTLFDSRIGGVIVVVIYAAATIWFTLFPEQVNRILPTPGDKEKKEAAR